MVHNSWAISEYFPLHVRGSVGIFDSPHMFGQYRLVSSKIVKWFLYRSWKLVVSPMYDSVVVPVVTARGGGEGTSL